MLWYYKKLIDKYKIISFDVFDTLVERHVLIPTDVYKNIGAEYVGKKQSDVFRFERMMAEKKARTESFFIGIHFKLRKYTQIMQYGKSICKVG